MVQFIHTSLENGIFEGTIQLDVYSKEIILRTAYNFLDRAYFFFIVQSNQTLIIQIHPKNDIFVIGKKFIGEFLDELKCVSLRDIIDTDNLKIRERIIQETLTGNIDIENFISFDYGILSHGEKKKALDFTKNIDNYF